MSYFNNDNRAKKLIYPLLLLVLNHYFVLPQFKNIVVKIYINKDNVFSIMCL